MARETRIGLGFDVHAFCTAEAAEGRQLMLAGLAVEGRPLAGHSDADVVLHALCDAIYGALGLGDIGQHFPPSDPQWKDQDSHHFLAACREAMEARAARLLNADITLIGEQPKISPIRDAMRRQLARLLDCEVARVNVKATTSERLGFLGREEGLACQAAVCLDVPA